MADYSPLIARAIAGLERNTAENRRALYERARAALVAQLRGMNPPLDEADITRERLALEEAIRRVESEAALRPRADEAQPPAGIGESAFRTPLQSSGARQTLSDQGLKGFREVVSEAEHLGGASARASRTAREFFDRPLENRSRPPAGKDRPSPEVFDAGRTPPEPEGGPSLAELEQLSSRERRDDPASDDGLPRSYGGAIRAVIVLLLVVGIGALAYWQRDRIVTIAASIMQPSQTDKSSQQPASTSPPKEQGKIADRVGSDGRPQSQNTPATAPAAAVAQKVVLYEEDPGNTQGKRFVGSAIWKTETVSPGPGLAPELVIKAEVEIPERRIRMVWSLRRNTDKALPASHTIEILFTLPADFPEGAVNNVPGVLMKQNEQTRGVPLAGLAVKVTNGFFLVGLSSAEVDSQRNLQLLKERSWFDVPVVYTSGKRAILAVEKGQPGERAFDEAFRAWGQ